MLGLDQQADITLPASAEGHGGTASGDHLVVHAGTHSYWPPRKMCGLSLISSGSWL